MSRLAWNKPLLAWAVKEIGRQPLFALLLFGALASTTLLMALVLLCGQALNAACAHRMAQSPAVLVQRPGAGGWMAMPVNASLSRVAQVAGVLRPRMRIWGSVDGPAQERVTVIGATQDLHARLPGGVTPVRGQVWIGPGVKLADRAALVSLQGCRSLTLAVSGRLPTDSDMVLYNSLVLHVDDARTLLGLNSDQASDMALDVFHEAEAAALRSDLAAAFDWPVQITTRAEVSARCLADIARRSGWMVLSMVPALLAIALLVVAIGAWGRRQRWEMGLLKALGWTGGDLLRLQLYQGMAIGLPAVAVGAASALALLFSPGIAWLMRRLFDWSGPAPSLYLTFKGTAGAFCLILVMTGLPYMAAVFQIGRQGAEADPADCIEGGC